MPLAMPVPDEPIIINHDEGVNHSLIDNQGLTMTPTIHPGKALIGELLARDWGAEKGDIELFAAAAALHKSAK